MNIFSILSNIYTNKDKQWILELDESDIVPFVIQRWLCMNDKMRNHVRWLDKYVFYLSPKMYLSLVWSITPKCQKTPFFKYIKKIDETEEFDFILQKVRKQFKLSDNDYMYIKDRLIKEIKKDLVSWFSYYGVPKKYWKKYYLDFNKIKDFGPKREPAQKGLDAFGL